MDDRTVKNINIGIVVMCVIAFLPVFKADFVYYDDPEYILGNQFIKKISLANIASIFMGKATLLYVPLTLISYMIEISLFGDKPFSFHFINLALHIVNCLLLFKILQRLNIKNSFIILFILMFFSVSPLVTESVCWATERKDVPLLLILFPFGPPIPCIPCVGKDKRYWLFFPVFYTRLFKQTHGGYIACLVIGIRHLSLW